MSQDDRIITLEKEVSELKAELARYKGFAGGVIFVVMSLWAVFEYVGPIVFRKLGLTH